MFVCLCMILIACHVYCGSAVYCIDCSRVSYVRLINQCGLYVDKIKIYKKKLVGAAYYTGVLNR